MEIGIMIEIVICLVLWFWGLTPLWLNILLSCLLFIRFSWRVALTITKVFKFNKELDEKAELAKKSELNKESTNKEI